MLSKMMLSRRVSVRASLAMLVAASFPAAADAATYTRLNNATALNAAGSWSTGGPPGTADIAQWTSAVANTAGNLAAPMGGNLSWAGISVVGPGGAPSIPAAGGFSLTLGASGINMSSATQNFSIAAPVILGSSQTWNVGNAAGRNLTVSGVVSGSGMTITKSGIGTLTLSGANTFNGGIILSAGTLNLNNAAAPGTGTLTINGGTIARSTASPVTLSNNNLQTWGGNFTLGGANNINFGTGAVTLTGNRTVTIGGSATYTQGGIIGGAFSLTTNNTGGGNTATGILALSGANAYTGGTSINGGVVQFNNASAIPATGNITIGINGALSVAGAHATLADWMAEPKLVSSSTGALSLAGSSSENFDPGAAGFNSISLGANAGTTATYTGTITPVSSTYRVGGGGGTIVFSNANTFTGATNVVVGNGGGGVVTFSNNNDYTGTTTISAGTLELGTTTLATSSIINNSTLRFTHTGSHTFDRDVSGSGGLTKAGTGTLTLSGATTYSGPTTVNAGILSAAADNRLSPNSAVELAGVGAGLDLAFDQTVSGLSVTTNSSTANTLQIASGKTLTVNGNVTIGNSTTASTTTALTATGGGSLNVQNNASDALFTVGGSSSSTGNGNRATADLSGLDSLTISLNTTNGIVRINPVSTSNVTDKYSTLILPSTGSGDTTITAATLALGTGGQNNGAAGQVNTLLLGSGVNTFHVNTINIGTSAVNTDRDVGSLLFNGPTGTIVVRNAAGSGGAALNIGVATGGGNTGVLGNNTVDLTGHHADLQFTTVVIGNSPRSANQTNTFSFDQGTLTMDSLSMAIKGSGGSTTNGATAGRTTTSILNIGGGIVAINNGVPNLGQVTANFNTGTFVTTGDGTINISGGTVTIGATSGTAIRMGDAIANTAASGTLNFTGGTTTINGNIVRGGGAGTTTATFNLDGGNVDMTNKTIGSAATPITMITAAGTLSNVGTINGTSGITKTTAGTLTLAGSNAYTGGTTINEGVLVAASSGALGTGTVTVNGTGRVLAIDGPAAVNVGGIGNLAIPTDNTLRLSEIGDQFTLTPGSVFTLGDITLDLSNAFNVPGIYTVIDSSPGFNTLGTTAFAGADQTNYTFSFAIINDDAVLTVTAIPEPSTLVLGSLLALGLVAHGIRQRRLAKR